MRHQLDAPGHLDPDHVGPRLGRLTDHDGEAGRRRKRLPAPMPPGLRCSSPTLASRPRENRRCGVGNATMLPALRTEPGAVRSRGNDLQPQLASLPHRYRWSVENVPRHTICRVFGRGLICLRRHYRWQLRVFLEKAGPMIESMILVIGIWLSSLSCAAPAAAIRGRTGRAQPGPSCQPG